MNDREKMLRGARIIMGACMNVQKEESVLIVTDPLTSFRISEVLFQAAEELGGHPAILYIQPPDNPGDEPCRLAAELMPKCDVIVTPTSKTLFHCPSVKQALARGARLGTLSEADEELLMEGAIEADFLALKPTVDQVAEIFTKGKKLEFTTPGGTSLVASIEGRAARANDSLCHDPGRSNGLPDLEVYIAPVEGTGNGRMVIDASSSAIGLIKEPIVITVENGLATKIEGGEEAERLRNILAKPGDKNCYNLAEMAVGLNPKARVRGKIIEDEGALGTCHCAVGTNLNFGGVVSAPIHIDMVQWKPTVLVDGEVIFENGVMKV